MKTKEQERKKVRKIMRNNTNGITLITLVITIIVLIILAGVSIDMIIGDNGIITQAQKAGRETANATIASEEEINALIEEMNQYEDGWEEDDKTEITINSLKPGDYIKYNSGVNGEILCRVLYPVDSEYGLQIISDKSVKNVTLGGSDWETGKKSYNSAIQTLNREAETYMNSTYATDARCVGSVPTVHDGIFINKNLETSGPTELQFKYNGSTSIDCKGQDAKCVTDRNQMDEFNILLTGEVYWLASLYVNSTLDYCGFRVSHVTSSANMNSDALCVVHSDGYTYGNAYERGLRPCILLKSDIKINAENGEDGTSSDKAYVIE